jgi:predicted SAM-dependent methyltransferase
MATTEPKTRRKAKLKLDLGCGQNVTPGFKGVDLDDADYIVDLFQFPWPFDNNSVTEVVSNHLIEHIPHYRPEYGGVDGFWMFFNELHRICAKNAKVVLTCPYARSDRRDWDPSHTRGIHEMNFWYFNQDWLEQNRLDHYPVTARFEIVTIDGTGVPDDIQNRNLEMQAQARNYYWNVVADLHVELKAVK